MEVEKASQPTLGQWSTAHFDSSQQQQKFLRLMGGLKKGVKTSGASSGPANMAMGQEEQRQLQQGLLGEFERAQLRRMDFNNRGVGLGFTPASNKKFSIDINTCRSVRFDD
ncbi:Lysine-rich nucleolar protein 1 [Oryzias melastigma]|uniref:Lysine-rich nucleolar protein 1 n=1 Tax=Oryzias melastigma TaxID=30732 RepID=A0A834FR97_ORYME|nr:Lysine-rich nucleolar protein 1 [Oryzias melastigma]